MSKAKTGQHNANNWTRRHLGRAVRVDDVGQRSMRLVVDGEVGLQTAESLG